MTIGHSPQITIRAMEWQDLETVSEIDKLSFTLPWPESAFKFELLENPAAAPVGGRNPGPCPG